MAKGIEKIKTMAEISKNMKTENCEHDSFTPTGRNRIVCKKGCTYMFEEEKCDECEYLFEEKYLYLGTQEIPKEAYENESKTNHSKLIRESEVEDIYVCEVCGTYNQVPRGCDVPDCYNEKCPSNGGTMNPRYTFEEMYPDMCRVKSEIKDRFNSKDYPDRTAYNAAMLGAQKVFRSICKDWNNIVWMEI